METLVTRENVYQAIDTEREYQDLRWAGTASSNRRSSNHGATDRTLDEFALYILGYANDLAKISSHTDNPTEKLDFVRKVAGLCVACMEAHGAPNREIPNELLNE
jgi:hypothetical protein